MYGFCDVVHVDINVDDLWQVKVHVPLVKGEHLVPCQKQHKTLLRKHKYKENLLNYKKVLCPAHTVIFCWI